MLHRISLPIISIIFLALLQFFVIQPLFSPGFFPIHDDEQVGRLYELDYAIKAGHIPPRLTQHLGFGYDYVLFNFYPPLAYYIAEVFVLLGFGYIASIKIIIGLSFFFSALGMYLFAKEFFSEAGSIAAAVAYSFVPYHAIDVYIRGALPESLGFVFLPFIFWSLTKIAKNPSLHFSVLSGVLIALSILAHNLIALMSFPYIAFYLFFLFIQSKEKKLFVFLSVLSLFLGFLLSAFFTLPALLEKKYTMVDLLTTELANYNLHFVYVKQLWNSPWGFGGSAYGLSDGISFQVGKLHLLLSQIGFIAFILLQRKKSKNLMLICLIEGLLLLSLCMTTLYARPIWDFVQPLWYIQFPWRFLLFVGFFTSFLVGLALSVIEDKRQQVGMLLLMAVSFVFFYYGLFQPKELKTQKTDDDYVAKDIIRWDTSRLAFEYVPKGIQTKTGPFGNTIVAITKEEIARQSYRATKDINVTVVEDKPQEKIFAVSAVRETQLTLNIYTFPGWRTYVDEKEVHYNDANKLKLITIMVPRGDHTIKVVFANTLVRNFGNTLTIIGIFSSIFLIFFARKIQHIFRINGKIIP